MDLNEGISQHMPLGSPSRSKGPSKVSVLGTAPRGSPAISYSHRSSLVLSTSKLEYCTQHGPKGEYLSLNEPFKKSLILNTGLTASLFLT